MDYLPDLKYNVKMKYQIKINNENINLAEIENFELEENKINFLLGESGIGKTIISKAIFGLLDEHKLSIAINNQNYSDYLKDDKTLQIKNYGFFVFQEPSSHFNSLLTIDTQIKEGSLGGKISEDDILQQLWVNPNDEHLSALLKIFPKPYRPSGGEKQRFLLAMAFKKIDQYLNKNKSARPLFVFDEPSGNLDDYLRNVFLKLLFQKYRRKSFTTLFITHDYSIISEVVNNHSDLLGEIIFNELVKKNNLIVLNKFDKKDYLDWLDSNISVKKKNTHPTNVLLTLDTEISVFNKRLNIYKDKAFKLPSPLQIHQNEIVYLKAPSGAGKTTIAKLIMGLIEANKFEFNIKNLKFNQDTPIKKWKDDIWGKLISMTFQHADEALNLNSTVKQTLLNLPKLNRPKSNELLSKLKMMFDSDTAESFLRKRIWQLSGGQKQRLNLLRALLLETPILILDEPLNGLDFESIKKITKILIQRKEQGAGILIISHNEEIIDTLVENESVYYLHQS